MIISRRFLNRFSRTPKPQLPRRRPKAAFISPPCSFPLFRRRSSIAPPTRPTHPKSGTPHPAPSTPRPPPRSAFAHFTRFFNRFDFDTSVSTLHLRNSRFLPPQHFSLPPQTPRRASAAPSISLPPPHRSTQSAVHPPPIRCPSFGYSASYFVDIGPPRPAILPISFGRTSNPVHLYYSPRFPLP